MSEVKKDLETVVETVEDSTKDVVEDLKDLSDTVTNKAKDSAEDVKEEAKNLRYEFEDKAEDLADDAKDAKNDVKAKAGEVYETTKKVAKEAYTKTADTVEKVLADEKVQEFGKKTVDVLDKTSKKVVSGAKSGAKFVAEKSEDFINDPRVGEAVEDVKEKSIEIGSKIKSGFKGLMKKVKKD